ncbi:MAG: chromate transporter [Ruminococcaceae bacterium]|nr:chromate transporter [Oscillospiraceae bacterium]
MLKKLLSLFLTFAKLGAITFGGGLTMLPLLKREIVEKKGWATEEELLDYYAVGQCTPGIIAVNTATFIGYNRAGWLGGVFATLGMITPSVIIIILIAALLSQVITYPIVGYALAGIRAAVCAMMANTCISLAKKSIKDGVGGAIFAVVFALSFFLDIPSVPLIIAAALVGLLVSYLKRKKAKKEADQ